MAAGWFSAAAALSGLGVLIGAFGAHGIGDRLTPDMLAVYETGVLYHLIHGLGLFAVAWAAERRPSHWIAAAGWLFIAGVLGFSGSLYLLAVSGAGWLGAIAAIGGACFLAGWAALCVGAGRAAPVGPAATAD